MNVHESFEVFDSLDAEFEGGVLVADKQRLGMLLKGGHRPHVVQSFFYGLVESKGLVRPSNKNHHLDRVYSRKSKVKDSTFSYGSEFEHPSGHKSGHI